MKKFLALLLALVMVFALAACGTDDPGNATTDPNAGESTPAESTNGESLGYVGISMPTQSLERWNRDGAFLRDQFEASGYKAELLYANNEVDQQVSDIQNLIADGVNLLVISAIDGESLNTVVDEAAENGIPVIAYDRLLTGTKNVDYYTTFDNYGVGVIQGQYIVDRFDLENAEGPFTIEFTGGSPDDNNAGLFFSGAYDTLKPYIDAGKLVVTSGQVDFETVATPAWKSETAQARMDNILSAYYPDALTGGTTLDICLCSNDSTALGVTNSLVSFGFTAENIPVITGQDCDIPNTKNMISGLQAMSVFKDTRTLADQTMKMVADILAGNTPETNATYDNGVMEVPSYNCTPVFADASNYKELLIDSGYYTEADLAE